MRRVFPWLDYHGAMGGSTTMLWRVGLGTTLMRRTGIPRGGRSGALRGLVADDIGPEFRRVLDHFDWE